MYLSNRGKTLPISLTGPFGALSAVVSFTLFLNYCCYTFTIFLPNWE